MIDSSLWVRLHGTPLRQFYADRALVDAGVLNANAASHRLLDSVGALRSSVAGEGSNVSIVLANAHGECRALLDPPPLAASVDVLVGTEVLFRGQVVSVTLGSDAVLEVEA